MGTIGQIINEFKTATGRIERAAQVALNSVVPLLVQDLQKRSPVDTGKYKQSWRKSQSKSVDTRVMASVGVKNTDPKAPLMEFGAEPKTAPWYFPDSKRTPTGKLTEAGGRIWAGGLNPGHSLTIGGAIDPVIFKNNARQLRIANLVANHIIKAI